MTDSITLIDTVLRNAIADGVAPGLVGIVARSDGEINVGAHGVAEVGGSAAMEPDTIFWLASMTKLVTTVAAMQLVEAGELSLDAPVADLLPELAKPVVLERFSDTGRPIRRPARGAITLRHLLTHRSGIGYDAMNLALFRARGPDGPPPPTSLAALQGPLVFDPGTGWEYGYGIDWVGLAVERQSGVRLDRYFADRIFAPLGMKDTGFDSHVAAPARCASQHLRQADASVIAIPSMTGVPSDWEYFSGGSGLFGTAVDYIRLLRMLLGGGQLDGARLLTEATVEAMWTSQSGCVPAGRVGTAIPVILPYDPLPGQDGQWSLLGVVNAHALPGRRQAGSASWVGAGGTFFWLDRRTDVCGVLLAQILPFADPALASVQQSFETAAYAGLPSVRGQGASHMQF